MSVPDPRGTIEQADQMPVDDASAAVIATELRLLKEDLGRRLDDHRDDIRGMRSEMASNYVNQKAYQAEYGRLTDRIGNVETDVAELRVTIKASIVELHGHIDRKLDELKVSRWRMVGLIVTVVLGLLSSATAVVVAVVAN